MKELKVIELNGGLGNQMFIYAFLRCLEIKHNKPVYIDDAVYGRQIQSENERYNITNHYNCKNLLGIFNLNEKYVTNEDLAEIKKNRKVNLPKIIRKIFNLPFYKEYMLVEDKPFVFNDLFLKDFQQVYYFGYFQNEKYFKEIEDVIRKEFVFPEFEEDDVYNRSLREQIVSAENPTFIHIRKGDYQRLGIDLPLDYYKEALKVFEEKVHNPTYFIFSDDEEFIRKEFPVQNKMVVVGGENFKNNVDYKDLQLMTYCKHAIIANSTFSWWGAWLMDNKDKIVIAPTPWLKFKSLKQSLHSDAIICDNWIKVDASQNRTCI